MRGCPLSDASVWQPHLHRRRGDGGETDGSDERLGAATLRISVQLFRLPRADEENDKQKQKTLPSKELCLCLVQSFVLMCFLRDSRERRGEESGGRGDIALEVDIAALRGCFTRGYKERSESGRALFSHSFSSRRSLIRVERM